MAVEGGIVLLSYAEDIAFLSFKASSSTLLLGLNEEIV